jgi:hypothetical protein
LPAGGNYVVTPAKPARLPASAGIDSVDVLRAQGIFVGRGPLPVPCELIAADVNGNNTVDTPDLIAIMRFFVGYTNGLGNAGKYQFSPASATYSGLSTDQTQDYEALVFGDVAPPFVEE